MFYLSFIALSSLLLLSPVAGLSDSNCYQYIHSAGALYDIESLFYQLDYIYSNSTSPLKQTLKYNFCKPTHTSCGESTDNGTAAVLIGKDGNCQKLTSNPIPSFNLINEHDSYAGIILNYSSPPPSALNTTYKYSVVLKCNQSQRFKVEDVLINHNLNEIEITVVAAAKEGCPYLMSHQFYEFVYSFRLVFVFFGGILGLFECFLGLKLFRLTLLVSGFLIIFHVVSFFLFTYALAGAGMGVQLASVFVAMFTAALGGFLLVKHDRLSIFLMGIWLGVVCAFLIYCAIFVHFGFGVTFLYVLLTLLGAAGGVLAGSLWGHLFIISTGVSGAYLAVRSLSLMIPHASFPNEFDLAMENTYNGHTKLPGIFYLYLVFIIGLAAAGIHYQYKHKQRLVAAKDEETQSSAYATI